MIRLIKSDDIADSSMLGPRITEGLEERMVGRSGGRHGSYEGAAQLENPPVLEGRHGARRTSLAIPPRDPFDRLLIARCILEALPPISNESLFEEAGVVHVWY